jgi:hypothetical protein
MAIKDRAPAVPNGWKAQFDDKYQTWFYVNLSSGKSQWEAPPSTKFPDEDKNLEPPPYAPSAASSSPVSATATGDSRGANKDPQPALQQQQYYQQQQYPPQGAYGGYGGYGGGYPPHQGYAGYPPQGMYGGYPPQPQQQQQQRRGMGNMGGMALGAGAGMLGGMALGSMMMGPGHVVENNYYGGDESGGGDMGGDFGGGDF